MEYLIMRNTKTPRFYDVVKVDFMNETAQVVSSNLDFEAAQMMVETFKG